MSIINFIGGEKGGVGKSVISRILAQYYIDNNISFMGYDTDRSHKTFIRFYKDYASPTTVDSYKDLDYLVENLENHSVERVIVDMAAQTNQPLFNWFEDSGVTEVAEELGISLKFWHVLDDSKDSTELLISLVKRFSNNISYIVVKNHGRGSDFQIFEASGIKEKVKELGGQIIDIRGLHESTMQKIDQYDTSFWAAVNNKNNDLGVFERQRIKTWLNNSYHEFSLINV
ncbi:MAG: hypothetical protein KDK36_12990 [Leptospiraceae bacterium]|nr:hypothetical protein [Leptospiraceae bacterium]